MMTCWTNSRRTVYGAGQLMVDGMSSIAHDSRTKGEHTRIRARRRHLGDSTWDSSGSYWKDSSLTFPFLSNFDGLTHVVPGLILTLTDLVELQPPITDLTSDPERCQRNSID